MKKSIIITATLLLSINVFSQSPYWQWAKSGIGTALDDAYGVATDTAGNVYIVGEYQSSTITFGTATLTNAGGDDIYLVKYDAAGNVKWARGAGGTDIDDAYAVSTDIMGNVYVTGMFASLSITFDTVTISNLSGADMFLVKYDAAGNALWAKRSGGTGYQAGMGVAADIAGNIYVAGTFVSPTISFGSSTFTNAGGHDIFIVKYNSIGNPIWATTVGGINNDLAASVTTDATGNLYVAGNFDSPSLTFDTVTIHKRDTTEMFIVKYNSAGNALWANNAGITNSDDINSVVTDAHNNVYVTGNYSSSTMTFGTTVIHNTGGDDWYIVKFNAGGKVLWAKSEGGTNNDDAYSAATDAEGNVYVAGDFFSSSITIGTTTLTNAGTNSYDGCLVKYDSTGNVKWAARLGGANGDVATSVATDAFGNAYLLGTFGSPSITFGTNTLTNSGNMDVFLAKIDTALSSVGINEIDDETGVEIFPNPFNSYTTISFSEEQNNTEIKLTDVMGRELKTFILKGTKNMVIDKGEMSAGVYFLQITETSTSSTQMKNTLRKIIIVQ